VFEDKTKELEEAKELHRQMKHKHQVEMEELEVLEEREQTIFGSLKKNFKTQLANLSKTKLSSILEMVKKNKDNPTVNCLAKTMCILFWSKTTGKALASGKMVASWVDIFFKKLKKNFEGLFMGMVQSCFTKKVVGLLRTYILGDKNIQKKISPKLLGIRVLRSLLLTKITIENKTNENHEFISTLLKQRETCVEFEKEVGICEEKEKRVDEEYQLLKQQIRESEVGLKSKREEVDMLEYNLENSKKYQHENHSEVSFDPRIVKPEIIFLDAVTCGVYFSMGYQISSDPMLLNGIKNIISFNCDQFLLEEGLSLSNERPLIQVFCNQSRIEKLFWGNYIFGIETLSKFQRITQCKLKFFVVKDPFGMCFNLVKEVNFKKDIIIVWSLLEFCIGDLHNAIREGKMVFLMNVRLSGILNTLSTWTPE
jgi:hypothetical protein